MRCVFNFSSLPARLAKGSIQLSSLLRVPDLGHLSCRKLSFTLDKVSVYRFSLPKECEIFASRIGSKAFPLLSCPIFWVLLILLPELAICRMHWLRLNSYDMFFVFPGLQPLALLSGEYPMHTELRCFFLSMFWSECETYMLNQLCVI